MLLPVTDDGVRPKGERDSCFYCDAPKGEHEPDCVCITKTVVVRMTIDYTVAVPASWSPKEIEDHRLNSSFCLGNDIEQLCDEHNAASDHCRICHRVKSVEFVRDAAEAETENYLAGQQEPIEELFVGISTTGAFRADLN